MSKHTPGPWEWDIESGDIEIRMGDAVESPGNHLAHNSFKYVDMIETYKKEQKEQAIANTQLIVAAPDLLKAAEKGLEYIKNGIEYGYIDPDQESDTPKMLEKAINKAKGADE